MADTAAAAPVAGELPGASVTFSAPPGTVDLRIVVENDRGQVVDSTLQTVTMPDYAQSPVSFSTPRVYRARTAREALQIRNNADMMPTTIREFSRGERVLMRFDAYTSGGGARPDVTAKLLNRTGQPMTDVPVQAVDGKPYLIDLALASLAAGEYIVEVDAKGAAGTARQMVGFQGGVLENSTTPQLPTPNKVPRRNSAKRPS